MSRWLRPTTVLGLTLVAVLGLLAPPVPVGAATWHTSVVSPGAAGAATTATTGAPDGSTHVFVSRGPADPVRHVVRTGGAWRTRTTPYRGTVLSATADSTGVLLLFRDVAGTFAVGKRTLAGRFVPAVPVRRVTGLVTQEAAAVLSVDGAWQVFLSYTSATGPDSPGIRSGLVTASSAAPTTVRVLRTSTALTVRAAWLPGRVVALVLGDEASRQVLFGRGAAGRWAFGPLGPGFGAPVDVVGRYGHLHATWIDGRDVLARESDGRAWGPVSRVAVLPGNRGAVSISVSLARTFIGWSSLEAVVDAPVRGAEVNVSERLPDGRWRTTRVTRAASPELLATTAVLGQPTLVYRLAAVVPGEVRALTRR